MKKIIILLSLVLFVTGLAVAQQVSVGKTYYVQVKSLTLKANSGSFSGDKGTLKYGDSVIVTKVDGKNWAEVKSVENDTITGWTSTANLNSKKIVAGSSTTTASVKEVALAGKGFSQEQEKSMKAQKPNLNYAEVDRTEKIVVHERQVKKFLEEGQLKMGDTAGDKK